MAMKATVLLRSDCSLDRLRRDANALTQELGKYVQSGVYRSVTDAWARLMPNEGGIDVSLIFDDDDVSLKEAEGVANALLAEACGDVGIALAAGEDTLHEADLALQNWGTELISA